MRLMTALFLLSVLAPASAVAQSASDPAPGERVYVHHDGQRIEGRLVALGDSLVIATEHGPTVVAPAPRVIYRHVGHTSRGEGFLSGAGVGGAAGAVLGAVIGYSDGDDPPGWFSLRAKDKAMIGAVMMGGLGVVVGGISGLVMSGDKWEALQVRPTIGIGATADADAVVIGFEARF